MTNNVIRVFVCIAVITAFMTGISAASINSEMSRYENANEKQFSAMEKSFTSQYKQFAGDKNVIVISGSANFETFNCVRSFKVLGNGKLRLTDYKGRTETLTIKSLQSKYECYVMAKAPAKFDTSGSLSSNFNALGK